MSRRTIFALLLRRLALVPVFAALALEMTAQPAPQPRPVLVPLHSDYDSLA